MLKLKRIDLLIKNDKIYNKSKNRCCDYVQKYKKDEFVCWEEGDILGGWVVVCSLGGESWDGEEEGEIEVERVGRVDLFAFTDGITNGHNLSVYLSVILTMNWPRHCTETPIWIPRLFCR